MKKQRFTPQKKVEIVMEAIKNHGKPASILTDHPSQFYANASEEKRKVYQSLNRN